ncbi:MAG: flavodoxin family protein [Candidatus Atribacteria bacterium]|nr:flavodoxin family protein [Candidatus Atribacteria bacterium]
MEVVAIYGSPRRGGNSEVMMDTFLQEVNPSDRVNRIVASQLHLGFCRGCRSCENTGHCVQKDDMSQVVEFLLLADRVVVSSPVFFYAFPSSLKVLIDRIQVLWSRKYLLKEEMKPKKGFLLAVGATKGKKLFDGIILTTRFFFDGFGCKYSGECVFRGYDKKGEIADCRECREEIRQAACSFLG